jgi:hypothetical protein
MDKREDIYRRALAFAESGDWCNPRIASEADADPEIVRIKGSGNVDDYRFLRVEVDMRPEFQSRVTKLATQNDESELEAFLEGTWTMDITCSNTDVIDVNFLFID